MTLFGGLFSRKSKARQRADSGGDGTANDNQEDGPPSPGSYVTPDKHVPSVPNGGTLHPDSARNNHLPPTSPAKMRLFGRKKSMVNDETDSVNSKSPRPPFFSSRSSTSEDPRRLRPPPSKSAIFAAYTDPNSALSTRSLPNHAPSPPAPSPKRSLFAWSKSPSKLHPPDPKKLAPIATDDSSFNLKSFRHVGPSSPAPSNNLSNVSLGLHTPPVRPRPRADTGLSDSSHRISVAAFREMQARRSQAGSPSPSTGRSPSPCPNPPPIPSSANNSRPPRLSPNPPQNRRKSGMSLFSSDTDDSDESDEDETYTQANRGRSTRGRAKSDMGHGGLRPPVSRPGGAKSHIGHDWSPPMPSQPPAPRPNSQALLSASTPPEAPLPRSQSSMSGLRPRASASASALTPSAAAKRANTLVSANAGIEADALGQYKQNSRHVRDSSVHSNPPEPPSTSAMKKASTHLGHGNFAAQYGAASDSDSDSDNAPLATLIAPRRPGSALSSYSNGNGSTRSATMPPKPLIDIKTLTGGSAVANKFGSAPTVHIHTTPSLVKSMDGFTGGQTLLSRIDPNLSSSRSQQSLVNKVPPTQSASPPPPPPAKDDMTRLAMPPRSVTMPLLTTPSISSMANGSGNGNLSGNEADRKRDALSERLSKAVRANSNLGSGSQLGHDTALQPPTLPPSASRTPSPSGVRRKAQSPDAPSRKSIAHSEHQMSTSPVDIDGDSASRHVPTAPRDSPALPAQPTRGFPMSRAKSTAGGGPDPDLPSSASVSTIRPPVSTSKPSPPDPSLADLLGIAGMKLISRNGESDESEDARRDTTAPARPAPHRRTAMESESDESESTGSDTETEESDGYGCGSVSGRNGPTRRVSRRRTAREAPRVTESPEEMQKEPEQEEKIVPILIKQRQPAPSFSVTSRPQISRGPQQQSNAISTVSSTSGSSRSSGGSIPGFYSGGASTSTSKATTPGSDNVKSEYDSARSPKLSSGFSSSQSTASSSTFTATANNGRKRSSTINTLIPSSSSSSPSFVAPTPQFIASSSNAGGGSPRNTPPIDLSASPAQNKAYSDRSSALRAVGATLAMQQQGPSAPGSQQQSRQRSSTLVPVMSPQPQQSAAGTPPPAMPHRPFAVRRDSPASSTGDSSSGRAPLTPRDGSDIGVNARDWGSVVGSSGASGIGQRNRDSGSEYAYSGGASGLGMAGRPKQKATKRRSVSFEQDALDGPEYRNGRLVARERAGSRTGPAYGSGSDVNAPGGHGKRRSVDVRRNAEVRRSVDLRQSGEEELEVRRKERRREEAKAAIELGEVVNGRGPILDDDDDDDLPMNQLNPRMSSVNPMMLNPLAMQQPLSFPGGMTPGWPMAPMNPMGMPMAMGMSPQLNPGMLSPGQFMPQPNTDPTFMAAHQQAMMYAKQAYQMAVAQQAMAAAGDEWERSSNMGGGSVYGGASTGPGSMIAPYGMGMMGAGGMGMMAPNNWSTGSAIVSPSSRSVYGGGGGGMSSSRSEYGGAVMSGRGGTAMHMWSSSRSSYGDLGGGVGHSRGHGVNGGSRGSMYSLMNVPPMPAIPPSASGSSLSLSTTGGGAPKNGGATNANPTPRQRVASQPALSARGGAKKGPPSSWKANAM